MKWSPLLTLVILALPPGLAVGQPPGSALFLGQGSTSTRPKVSLREIHEDMEVMGRLLERGLAHPESLTGIHGMAFSPDGRVLATQTDQGTVRLWDATGRTFANCPALQHGGAPKDTMHGVYLPNQGIVYSMTVFHPEAKVWTSTTSTSQTELSAWERAKRELRGEKIEPTKPTPAAMPGLANKVLDVLAANGKHLRLGESEFVTVSLRLAMGNAAACSRCHTSGPRDPGAIPGSRPRLTPTDGAAPGGIPGTSSNSPRLTAPGHAPTSDELGQLMTLGDLHLRQKEYPKAIQAYTRALNLLYGGKSDSPTGQGATLGTNLPPHKATYQIAEVLAKLAQAQLLGDDAKGAEATWRGLTRLATNVVPKDVAAAPARPAAGPTPRLMITVKKATLDLIAAEKLSVAEFHKQAEVVHLTFEEPTKPTPR